MKDQHLKLQAYADGELSPSEMAEVEALLAADASARASVTAIRQTTAAFKGYGESLRLPESREFFWSKVRREIYRQESAATAKARTQEQAPASAVGWARTLRRFLMPAGALAAVALAAMLATRDSGLLAVAQPPSMEAALSSPGTLTYRDFSTRTTLVWLSYPAENRLDQ